MSGPFKVAAVQALPVFLDLDGTVEKAVALIDKARRQGRQADRLSGDLDSRLPVVDLAGRAGLGMQFVGRYFENSIEIGSDHDRALAEAAARNGMHVIVGVSERAGGSLYMGQWHYGPDGEIVNRCRNLKPTRVERTLFGEGDGSDIVVHDTDTGRVGALCCWEQLQPLTKYAMYAQHEQIHIASWPSFSLYRGAAYALGPELNTSPARCMRPRVSASCWLPAPRSPTR